MSKFQIILLFIFSVIVSMLPQIFGLTHKEVLVEYLFVCVTLGTVFALAMGSKNE